MRGSQRAPLTRLEVLRGLRLSIWEGIWATAFMALTTGAFQIGFARSLGASDFALGLMAALPAAANLLQLPASLLVERRGERRTFVAFMAAGGRCTWALILLVPFALPAALRLPTFLLLLAISSSLLSASAPAWTSWMSDMVPPRSRGQYFARRNMLASIATMLVPLPAGAFLDQAVRHGRFDPQIGFAVLFAVAVGASLLSLSLILRQPEPPMQTLAAVPGAGGGLRTLTAPITDDPNFRRFLLFAGATVFGQTLAGQFFVAWQVDAAGLKLPYFTVQLLGAVAAGAGLAAMPLMGLLSDKFGSRPVLVLSSVGVIISPFLWLFTNPGENSLWLNVGLIVLLNLCSGAAWAGIGLAQFNLLLGLAPPSGRGTYSALFAALTGIIGAFAPILGGALMVALKPVHIYLLAGLEVNNYKLLFLLTLLVRIGCVFLLSGVRESDSRSARYVLGQLATGARRPVASFVTLRRMGRPVSEGERQRAVSALAEIRSPLAVEELAHALGDVSQEVRERAAHALGEIRDPRAVPALAARLSDPAADIGELAADALGTIGHADATTALMTAAEGPDAGVRVAALRALARIADPACAPVLLRALNPTHPSTCEAASGAVVAIAPYLSSEAAVEALPRLLYLLSQEVDRGMRLTAARALRALLPRFSPATSAEIYRDVHLRLDEETDGAVLAQEAGALVRAGQRAGIPASVLTDTLLPLLRDPAIRGLANTQLLETVAEIGLEAGVFYPYLGLTEIARDEATSRLLQEIKRRAVPPPARSALDAALAAYVSGDYTRCITALWQAVEGAGEPAEGGAQQEVLGGLARLAEAHGDIRAEEALLGTLLTRRILGA
ncbi:MAG: MFS transporter [Cytophagales bacterium]|nr:MFS transporter [Armatimonadota bacterium]